MSYATTLVQWHGNYIIEQYGDDFEESEGEKEDKYEDDFDELDKNEAKSAHTSEGSPAATPKSRSYRSNSEDDEEKTAREVSSGYVLAMVRSGYVFAMVTLGYVLAVVLSSGYVLTVLKYYSVHFIRQTLFKSDNNIC